MSNKINGKMIKRGLILLGVFLILSIIIVFSLFKLQILDYESYQSSVLDQLTVETNVNPLRGVIYERNGKILATNKTVWILYLIPKNIKNPEFIAKNLSEITGLKYETILNKAQKTGYKYQIIHNALDEDTTTKIRKFIDENDLTDQIQLNASAKRYYPYTTLASHALGFVNGDGVGIYGLERSYNNILEGTSGKYITAQNAQSGEMPFQFEEYLELSDSYNIVSTIDLYLQYQLEAQLKIASIEAGAKNRSAGIVMNPKTGEIYAMAVYPSFDLNEPYTLDLSSQEILNKYDNGTKEYKNEYLNLLFTMWNNKAITELYEPGSTFKLVTTSVALQEGAATLNSGFHCSGSLKIDGFYRAISCHKRTGHGSLTFAEALQQSCNPSMMILSSRIGKEKFYDYFKRFGYTSTTGIDLPSEARGYYHSFNDFSNVSLAVYSFGQTFKTTPIQQLRAVCAVANGGYLVTPHLLKEITDTEGNTVYEYNTQKGEQIISTDVCSTISQILKEGVDGAGGAKNAYVAGYSIAAKTGTSEKKDKYDENGNTPYRVSSCVAYAPANDPQIAIIMLVDEPSIGSAYGSVVVAPYVSSFMELALPYLGIEAVFSEDDKEHEQISVPDVCNMTLEEAKDILKKLEINFEVIGNGENIISQTPIENSIIYKKTGKILLYTSTDNPKHGIVPNVIGKTPEEANKILINAGFNIKLEVSLNLSKHSGATIISQYPVANEYYELGKPVTIKILYTDEKD
ncbi:MAG: PASTA domain-containing protein [Clostridia bacterium]|nr:PASTA domain-containing protein [Clostridia bacterium]